MENFVEKIESNNIDDVDGILYKDIKHILNSKIEIENVLFTTRVMFLNNEELMEFMNKLMKFGYEDMALDYVENIYDKVTMDFSKLRRYENNSKQ